MLSRLVQQLVMVVCVILTTPLVAANYAADKDHILHPTGLLWKIEKPNLRPSYIYGTMHVSRKEVVTLAPAVERVFVNAERFAMEMLMTIEAVAVVTGRSFFNDGKTLKTVMQPDDFKKLSAFMMSRFSMSEDMFIHMRPWTLLTLLMIPPEEWGKDSAALDMVLYRRAALRKIPLLGLETVEEQLAVLESLTLDEQIWMLNKTVADYDEMEKQFAVMYEAYFRRDLAGLVKMQQDSMYEDSDIDDRFVKQLVDVRNLRMVERMQDFLQQGNAFIAIGALHLPGEQGVLHLLEQRGFSVSPVY